MAIFMLPNFAFALIQNTNYPHIKVGAVNYWSSWLTQSEADKAKIKEWQANHLDMAIGGANLLQYNANVLSGGYIDHVYVYPSAINRQYTVVNGVRTLIPASVRQTAADNGFVFEDMLAHMSVNYQVPASYAHTGMDRFDSGETNSIGTYVNGVLLLNGSAYTDKTTAAYDATSADVSITDKLLIGSSDPFADINFVLSTVATDKTVTVDYWNGSSWVTLIGTDGYLDGTNGLTQNGLITFIPPYDWTKTSFNNSLPKWWVRFTVSGAGTSPVASRIYGDNQLATDGSNNSRGWNANDPNIIGTGELAYNPTPPANATAKFRHQARLTGMWAANAVFGNPSNIQNGKRTWATYNADAAKGILSLSNGKLMMFDDGNVGPIITAPANALTNYSDITGNAQTERIASYAYTKQLIQQAYPDVKVGSNTRTMDFAYAGDWNLNEVTPETINIKGTTKFDAINPSGLYSESFDAYLPANNPNNIAGVMNFLDSTSYGKVDGSGNWYPWDRGYRSPILALATYYIGANENTYFGLNIGGTSYGYYSSPGVVHYFSPSTTILTQELPQANTAAIQDIYGADFSAFPPAATIRVGNNIFYSYTKINNTHLRTTLPSKVYSAWPVGTTVSFVVEKNLALDTIPENVEYESWGGWFPAIEANVGTPTESRNLTWKLWSEIGGSAAASGNVWKRDYTNALILVRPNNWDTTAAWANTPGLIELGGTYYPLTVLGRTGGPITSIQLKTGEGAILMKAPIGTDPIAPATPTGLSVQ